MLDKAKTSYVLLVLRENCGRHPLWGTAKIYLNGDGIRYSMRIGNVGVTNHLLGAHKIPNLSPIIKSTWDIDQQGYAMAAVDDTGGSWDISIDEKWIDSILLAVRSDYDDKSAA